ncbi:MAG: ABC-2 transporter permease [Coriobacteriia bacterium]|nr:ABC-2 transporter permease [Coriobacteriia bacterium]
MNKPSGISIHLLSLEVRPATGTTPVVISKALSSSLMAVKISLKLGLIFLVIPTIIGRYLYALLLMGVSLSLGTLLSLAVSRITGTEIEWLGSWAVLTVGFAYCCLIVGVGFPVYLRLEYQKAYAIANIPMLGVAIAAIVLSRTTDLLSNFSDVILFFNDHLALLPLLGAVVGISLLGVSVVVANGIYKQKEI